MNRIGTFTVTAFTFNPPCFITLFSLPRNTLHHPAVMLEIYQYLKIQSSQKHEMPRGNAKPFYAT